MTVSTLSQNGQTTIPVEIRRLLGLKPNQKIGYRIEDGQVHLEALPSTTAALYGCLKTDKKPKGTIEEARKKYAAKKYGT